jgi:acylphosphatase
MPAAAKLLRIKGLVQGVGFRAAVHREAQRIGDLRGWVRNLPDGDVEVLVQGEPKNVEALVDFCRRGPRASRVDDLIESEARPDSPLGPFAIRA